MQMQSGQRFLVALVLAVCATALEMQAQIGIVTNMTPELVAEAIKVGEKGDVPSGRLTQSSGFSWGSVHIATFSTPFMRVAMAARQAKKEYRKFTPADVTPEMIAPELHVYAWSQGLAENGPDTANVTAVVITPKKGNKEEKAGKAIQSLRFEPIPQTFQNLLGAKVEGVGRMAVFPLNALSEDNEVHVVYDKNAKMGENAAGGRHCDDCHAGFSLKGVR
jgi:hypothetical protein